MSLHVKKLSQKNSKQFDGFYAIYACAFPLSEQKSRATLLAMIDSSTYTIYLAYYDEKIVGFSIMYHPLNDDFFLLEYMAIDENVRGIGLGSTLLKYCQEDLYKTYGIRAILIEIDSAQKASDEQEIREKREQFYRRLGTKRIEPFDYILALNSEQTPPPMELLVWHPSLKTVAKEHLQKWLEKLYVDVYGSSKNDPRIALMLESTPASLNLI